MESLLYYPGFEVKNLTWLKFALLYLDELRPIIPYTFYNEDHYLSEYAIRVMHETDLINPYCPDFEEGTCASILACNEFDLLIRHPERYAAAFGYKHENHLLKDLWNNPRYHICTLYNGKFSGSFADYCIENKIATRCDEGIRLPEELAFVYMSLLADTISKNRELEMITDIRKYSDLLLKKDRDMTRANGQRLDIAKNNIEFNIPMNLNDIPLENIIRLRNQSDFHNCRKAYMCEISKLIDAKEKISSDYSLENMLSVKKDFLKICRNSFDMLAPVTLTVTSILPFYNTENINAWTALIAVMGAVEEIHAIRDAANELPEFIENMKSKRLARKYIAKLGQLNEFVR